MRIVVNRDLCESNGVCVRLAPDLFVIDEHDKLKILGEHPSPEQLERARKAVSRCPRTALSLVDE
jgi:ferredoxin